MKAISVLGRFVVARKKDLIAIALFWIALVAFKLGNPEFYTNSRFRGLGDLSIYVVAPLGILWEWREFRKDSGGVFKKDVDGDG